MGRFRLMLLCFLQAQALSSAWSVFLCFYHLGLIHSWKIWKTPKKKESGKVCDELGAHVKSLLGKAATHHFLSCRVSAQGNRVFSELQPQRPAVEPALGSDLSVQDLVQVLVLSWLVFIPYFHFTRVLTAMKIKYYLHKFHRSPSPVGAALR